MKAYSKASDILHVLEPPPPFQASMHRINSLQSSKHVALVIIWLVSLLFFQTRFHMFRGSQRDVVYLG